MQSRYTEHPLDFSDDKAMAEHWGDELLYHIRRYVELGEVESAERTGMDIRMDNIDRATRMAAWHGIRHLAGKKARQI